MSKTFNETVPRIVPLCALPGTHKLIIILQTWKLLGVVIPYTAVVTAKTGVKKWSRGVFGVGQEDEDQF